MIMECADNLSDKDIIILSTLKERFQSVGGITPYKAFNINYPTLISGIGIAATYLLVMLQFKTAEL